MYPDRRGGFNSQDRTLWRKDRYNAVYGRYRDKNGEYRDKNGHKLGDDNVTLLSFNDDKPFPGWANAPGSQFHPDDHPEVDADFYRNRENWPAKGLRSLALYPFEDDWNENGVPLKNEFHDLTTLPAFKGLDSKQLPDRVDMDKVFELQQQAIQNQRYAAQQQPNQPANTLQQIGNIVQAAAPLVAQGVSALAGVVSGPETPGNLSNQLADTMHQSPKAGRNGVFYTGEFDPAPNSTPDFGKPGWESDLMRNYQTLEYRPENNNEVVYERNLVPKQDPFERERIEVVPLAAKGDSARPVAGSADRTDLGGSGHSSNPGDLSGERYSDQGLGPVRSDNGFKVYGWANNAASDAAEAILPPIIKGGSRILYPDQGIEALPLPVAVAYPPLGYELLKRNLSPTQGIELKGKVTPDIRDIDPDETPEDRIREQAMAVRLPWKVMARLEELEDLPQDQRLEIIKSEFKSSEL